MGNIIVAGSINIDIVTRMTRVPRRGETVFGDELHYIPGGKGSNQAVSASRLGENVYLGEKKIYRQGVITDGRSREAPTICNNPLVQKEVFSWK